MQFSVKTGNVRWFERKQLADGSVAYFRNGERINARYCGRTPAFGGPDKFANVYRAGRDGTLEQVLAKYRKYIWQQFLNGIVTVDDLWEMDGRMLLCHCKPKDCHTDVVADMARWASGVVVVHTDGSCLGNPGRGGWAAVIETYGMDAPSELVGSDPNTTNNRMELTAVLDAFRFIERMGSRTVVLYTDSEYVVGGLNGGNLRKNLDLWEPVKELLELHHVIPVWVKGHDDNSGNNRCDTLAREAAERGL